MISDNTVRSRGAREEWWDQLGLEEYPTTLLHKPLLAEEISKLEQRLDTPLPADYKEFLSYTNGLDESWGGILMDPPLYRANDVHWVDGSADTIPTFYPYNCWMCISSILIAI